MTISSEKSATWLRDAERRARTLGPVTPEHPSGPPDPEEHYLVAWVGLKDATGTTVPMVEVIDSLRQFDRWGLLTLLSKISFLLAGESIRTSELQRWLIHGLLDREIGTRVLAMIEREKLSFAFHRLQVLNAIKLCLRFGSDSGGRGVDTPNDLWVIGKALLALNDHLDASPIAPGTPTSKQKEILATWALKSLLFHSTDRFAYDLIRYMWLYSRLAREAKRVRRGAQIDTTVRRHIGVGLNTLISTTFGLLVNWPELSPKDLESPPKIDTLDLETYFKPTRVARKEVELVVGWLSQTVGEASASTAAEIRIEDGRFLSVFEHLSVRRKPLILRDRRFLLCLDRSYLMERITSGAYWTVFDGLKGRDREILSSLFGEAVHRYSRMLLRRMFGRGYRQLIYQRGGRGEAADGVLVCGDEIVVLEVKTAHLLLTTQQHGDLESFRKDVRKIVTKAAGQISRAIELIRTGKVRVPGIRPGTELNYHPVVVTAEEFPTFPLLGEIVDEEIGAAKHLTGRRIAPLTILQLEDLEMLEPVVDEVRFLELLKRRYGDERLRGQSFRNFLLEVYGGSLPGNKWMHREYERLATRIKRRLFGAGTDPVKVE